MATRNEKIIAVIIATAGFWLMQFILKPFDLSAELHRLISSATVYFFGTVFVIFEFVKDDKGKFFSKFTLVWILTDLFVIGLRLYLYYIGIVPSLTGFSDFLLWIIGAILTCVIAVSIQALFNVGEFAEDGPKEKKLVNSRKRDSLKNKK